MGDVSTGFRTGASAIVLAGGRARRFGSDKLAAPVRGRPLVHLAIEAAAAVCDQVVLVTAPTGPSVAPPPELGARVDVVPDARRGEGPLVALVAGLRAARHDRILVVAGDMPDLHPGVLRRLLAWPPDRAGAFLVAGERDQPLPLGLDRAAALATGERLVAGGERRFGRLLQEIVVEPIPEAEWRQLDPAGLTLRDIDDPADLEVVRPADTADGASARGQLSSSPQKAPPSPTSRK